MPFPLPHTNGPTRPRVSGFTGTRRWLGRGHVSTAGGGGRKDRAGELLEVLRGMDTVTGRPSWELTPPYRSRVSTSITTRLRSRRGLGGGHACLHTFTHRDTQCSDLPQLGPDMRRCGLTRGLNRTGSPARGAPRGQRPQWENLDRPRCASGSPSGPRRPRKATQTRGERYGYLEKPCFWPGTRWCKRRSGRGYPRTELYCNTGGGAGLGLRLWGWGWLLVIRGTIDEVSQHGSRVILLLLGTKT